MLSLLFLLLLNSYSIHSILLSGHHSYSVYPDYYSNSSLSIEFSTLNPSGLLLYTQDDGDVYYLELKLVNGQLKLRYDLDYNGNRIIAIGNKLNDGLWHRVEIIIGKSVLVTLDGFMSVGGPGGGQTNRVFKGKLYVGGLPSHFIENLDLITHPSVLFEPRWIGGVRKIEYNHVPIAPIRGNEIQQVKDCNYFYLARAFLCLFPCTV